MITRAAQDYVKTILKLESDSVEVSTSSLASTLGVTPSSVCGMLKKLSKERMVSYRQYRGVRLTRKGKRSALEVLRRHRLIELFLIEVLKMPWESVHREAETLEHVVSDEVLARIDELLAYPKHDPHGSPIPSPDGKLSISKAIRLDQLQVDQRGIVCEVEDDDSAMLQHLQKIGLVPGVRITVNCVLSIDGSRELRNGKRVLTVSEKVASAVWVQIEQG